MEIKNIGYNFGEITIDTSLTSGTAAEIGTEADYQKIVNVAMNSGFARINATIGGTAMSVGCFVNAEDSAVSIGGITTVSDTATFVSGTFYVSSHKLYADITVTALSANRTTKAASK